MRTRGHQRGESADKGGETPLESVFTGRLVHRYEIKKKLRGVGEEEG